MLLIETYSSYSIDGILAVCEAAETERTQVRATAATQKQFRVEFSN